MQIDSTRPLHRLVPLTKNQFAIIDEEDDPWIGQYKWFCSAYGYAVRGADKGGRRTILYMHRVILGTSPGIQVDHINGNRLDNRRCNLREVTSAQNKYNMRRRGGSSRY